MSEEKTTAKRSATVELVGKPLADFELVKKHVNDTLPGVTPNNADVVRQALHMAAKSIPLDVLAANE